MRPRWWWLAVLGPVVALVVAACGGGDAGKATWRTPAGSPASSPADPQQAAKVKALTAYRGMWRVYMAATHTADPDDPQLARYAAGEALRVLRSGLRWMRKEGLRGGVRLAPTADRLIPAEAPRVASIGDCVDTSATRMYRANGDRYTDAPGGRRALSATVKDVGGGAWKVTNFGIRAVGTCR